MSGRRHARLSTLFPPPDVAAVEASIARAEERTSAEIVAWVTPASDTYPEAPLRGALLGMIAARSPCTG